MEAERDRPPVLVVVGGLPATGKTTIAVALARQVGAAFLRVDSIEQAILRGDGAGPKAEPSTSRT